jgi:hypothetical protein
VRKGLPAIAVAFIGLGAAVSGSAQSAQTQTAKDASSRACPPVSVYLGGSKTFTYEVVIATGEVSCVVAREDVRSFALLNYAPRGARCQVSVGAAWAFACVRGASIVRAFGPEIETDPWVIAAAKLDMPVFAPRALVGFTFKTIRPQKRACGPRQEQVSANYTRPDGAKLDVAEGRPEFCANLGNPLLLARLQVQGRQAELYELCAPAGCSRRSGEFALQWYALGVQITLLTKAVAAAELLRFARSFALVLA